MNIWKQVKVQLYDLCHDIVGSIILVVVVWGSRASNLDNKVEELQYYSKPPIVFKSNTNVQGHQQYQRTPKFAICAICILTVPTKAPFNW